MSPYRKIFVLLLLNAVISWETIGQQLTIDTDEIQTLIERWNVIHNKRSHAFDNVYDDELWFYTERVTREKATLLKKLLFVRNPEYKQKISGSIKYTLHKNGIVKCEFDRAAWKKTRWETQSMYLLVGYRKHGYWVIGESDYKTDKERGFTAKISKPLDVEILSGKIDDAHMELPARTDFNNTLFFKDFIPSHVIWFVVIGLVGSGALVVLFKNGKLPKLPVQNRDAAKAIKPEPLKPGKKEKTRSSLVCHPVEFAVKQKAFEHYLLKIFDPLFFKHLKSGNTPPSGETIKDENQLEFEFRKKNCEPAKFTLRYIYSDDTNNEVNLLPFNGSQDVNHVVEGNLYYVVGLGGSPDDPDSLYLIPSRRVKPGAYNKEALQPFKKFGMFFFNSSQNQLV